MLLTLHLSAWYIKFEAIDCAFTKPRKDPSQHVTALLISIVFQGTKIILSMSRPVPITQLLWDITD